MKKLILSFILLLVFCSISFAQVPFPGWGIVKATGGGDTTPPTLSTATIGTNGTTWTFVFSETVSVGAGGSAGWAVTMSTAGAETLTYISGSGSATLIYSGSVEVLTGETVSVGLNYTQPGNGIEDAAGNDLANVASHAVVNSSVVALHDDFTVDDMAANWAASPEYCAIASGVMTCYRSGAAFSENRLYTHAATGNVKHWSSVKFTQIITNTGYGGPFIIIRSANDTGSFYVVGYDYTSHIVYLSRFANWAWAADCPLTFDHTLADGSWLKANVELTGTSTKIYAYYSSDGTTWTLLDSDSDGITWSFATSAQRPDTTYANTGQYVGIGASVQNACSNTGQKFDSFKGGTW